MFNTLKGVFEKMSVFDKSLGVVVVLGLVIVVTSLFRGIMRSSKVELVETKMEVGNSDRKNIFVDIEGAVVAPGVYELTYGDRLKDVLVLSGGFSELADRIYVQKTINLAELLKDGQKIYIPFLSDTPQGGGYLEAKNDQRVVNVNTASIDILDTLWGIGEARAENIVKNRPYSSLEEMVSKKVITQQILEKNNGVMSVY
ncbi:hypothetical protein A2572_03725 [Candidatus Collierbacteria bacterium RIFOXYD1_FULL_40_9]|uniref:Soluble ligand binding domain-containing protein n=1 Tax=Candidatus Collierbacteria bacterium RIFOXYD1_FULL_40_9 TaxID=1817731 RepID=A0A1F5FTD3_9BACT|nr:MAG: hypothetical protein A2572_03725 [Candidatus Collierbacteria bacterium RIFOXYD1_FULL_40_9]